MMALFARPEKELLNTSPVEYLHPEDKPAALEAIKNAYATGMTAGPHNFRVIDGNGEIVHVQLTNTLLSLPNDRVLGVSFVQDMTPTKEALDQQNKMVQAIERIEETVVLADGHGRIFYANPAALNNSGYTLEEVIGKPIWMFNAPEGGEAFSQQAMVEILKRGWWRGDIMAITKTGTRYPVEVIGSVVRDDKGEVSMFVAVSRKTSERQRFEAQLVMAKSHFERIQDLCEYEVFPGMAKTVERLRELLATDMGPEEREEMVGLVAEQEEILGMATEVVGGLPPPERAEELMPLNLSTLLSQRLPAMAARYRHDGKAIDLDLRVPDGRTVVMANTMLPDLILRLIQVLLVRARMDNRVFKVEVASGTSQDIPGTKVEEGVDATMAPFATISISAPGLAVDDDLSSILTRQELHTRGTLPPEQTIAVETSRLLLFLFNGRIIIDTDEETGYQRILIVLPRTEVP
jgi:PAS domain S-box-containing protein